MKTAVKICGVRDPDIARQAIALGAQYVGIVCHPSSSRYVEPLLGQQIASVASDAGGIAVAVFVDYDAQQMLSLCETMGVHTVQLAGPISRQTHGQLPNDFQRIYVLHVEEDGVLQPDTDQGLSNLVSARDQLMYDSVQSGSGHAFHWEAFENPYSLPFFLAGGLTPENVEAAINTVHPDVVDVSSGVESAPGVKDLNKIAAFIEAARGAKR